MDRFINFTLNIRGRLHKFSRPLIMGILNVTPDSFYSPSRTFKPFEIEKRVEQLVAEGADIIDIGGYSSRPGADDICAKEETKRMARGLKAVRSIAPDILVSVDTFRADIARNAVEDFGADIINDISGGNLDSQMFATVAELKAPYILMHLRGTPTTMQSLTHYTNVTADVTLELSEKIVTLEALGVNDIIVDPGFGFSKTAEQNYEMLHNLTHFSKALHKPLLVGISRKSMLTRPLGIAPDEALAATTAANTIALLNGASILRVHDVKAAKDALAVTRLTLNPSNTPALP